MGHTPKTNEICPHGLEHNSCGYCWHKAIANMIDENTNLKQTVATQQARIEALEAERSASTVKQLIPVLCKAANRERVRLTIKHDGCTYTVDRCTWPPQQEGREHG